jgi:hypothetical protein
MNKNIKFTPTHEAADAFWKYWKENGETHKHGYYESTWGAINAALNAKPKPRPICLIGGTIDQEISRE